MNNYYIDFDDFLQHIISDKFILIEHKSSKRERILGCYDTEIDSLRIYNRVSHRNKCIVEVSVVLAEVFNKDVVIGYIE